MCRVGGRFLLLSLGLLTLPGAAGAQAPRRVPLVAVRILARADRVIQ